ncbi:MAG: LptF/LptG family permease [Nitrospirota bacterium]
MLLIQRLYIKEFLKSLVVLGLGIALIFSIMGFIDKIDDFMPHRPSAVLLLKYIGLTIPKYLNYLMAMATLLSSLFIFSQAIKRKEIVVIKAAAGRMKKILLPFVGIGIALTLFGFVLGEIIVPLTSKEVRAVKNQITKKKKGVTFKEGSLYMRAKDGSIVRIGLYLPEQNISQEVSIFKFDAGGLKERVDAETAEWAGDTWKLKNVALLDVASGKVTTMVELLYPSIESPKIFQEDMWEISEMTMPELIQYQKRLTTAGFKNPKLTVDISSRLSYPLINLFMLLLGIALSVGGEQKALKSLIPARFSTHGGIIAAGLGLLISLIYWFSYSLFLSLGYAGALPPIIAPWIVPALFAVISVYLYSRIPE